MQIITSIWQKISEKYQIPLNINTEILKEILTAYTAKKRYYHNVTHIEHLLSQTQVFENQLKDSDTVYFAVLFHDIVYDATKNNNEERSAVLAKRMMQKANIEVGKIQKVYDYILATKKHQPVPHDADLQFLLDIDLSILASEPAHYQEYVKQIRKEYSIYPDFMYKSGRKKAMQSFLEREQIFYFYDQSYEQRARENIGNEISTLA
jgi:predicted metal-dependent HD superfamily phosphohydrolase